MGKEDIHVLYIDDEVNNLNAFRAIFRRQYRIFTSSNTLEARRILREKDIHVIISDQKMPDTTGVEFFNIVKEEYPGPKRILLTAFSDIDATIDAINKGHIYKYIKKPWEDYELENAIDTAFQIYAAQNEMEQKVKEMERINHIVNKVLYDASHALRYSFLSNLGIIKLSHSDPSFKDPNGYLRSIESKILRSYNLLGYISGYYEHAATKPDYEQVNFEVFIKECFENCRVGGYSVDFKVNIAQETEFFTDIYRLKIFFNYVIFNIIEAKKSISSRLEIPFSIVVEKENTSVEIGDDSVALFEKSLLKLLYPSARRKGTDDPMLDMK